jgi:trigger factor
VQTEVTEAGPFERLMTLHIDESELESAKTAAARKLAGQMKIKGFRPGKAPRQVVERMVGAATLRREAIDEALPELVGAAILETELVPVTPPQIEAIRDGDDGAVEVDVKLTLWPELERVPDYRDRKITIEIPQVEDEEVEAQIDRLRNQYAELEDVERPSAEGDFVMVNITALDNGTEIKDASASDLLYEVGSRSFISGLDEVVAGASAGDIREGEGMLPEGFGDHGGQEITLRVLVKGVRGKKLPEVTDEWVSDVSEFETVAELTDRLTENLRGMKLGVAADAFREGLMQDLTEEMDLEVPEALVQAEMESMVHNIQHSLEQQGIDLSNFLRITGQDEQAFVADLKVRATQSLKTRILLEAVVADAELTVDDEEMAQAIASIAAQSEASEDDVREALAEGGREQVLTSDILRSKAIEHVLAEASAIDAEGNPVDLSPPQPEADDDEEESQEDSGEQADTEDVDDPDADTGDAE